MELYVCFSPFSLSSLAFKDGQWTVGETLDFTSEKYHLKCLQQLQLVRKEWLEEQQKPKDATDLTNDQDFERTVTQSEETEKELKKKENELLETILLLHEEKEDYKRMHGTLQQAVTIMSQEIKEKDHRIETITEDLRHEREEKQREVQRYHQQLLELERQLPTKDCWVVKKDELKMTEEVLGKGSYGKVTVGVFRGLRVAVKSLHNIIISDYNLELFSREMNIASQVRHPNLVQFIGATKVGAPLILTELMSTSLHKVLQEKRLTKQQILSIAQDIALGLNYLHLFEPRPIIHRDVSSPNVLLEPSVNEAGYKAKVADYGTAKLLQGTSTGTAMPGNPAYAAPEARDPDQHSPAMDVYSYSVLLMEMTLCAPPEMTSADREQQSHRVVLWSPMKSLIQSGLNNSQDRPTMAQVMESLKKMKV